MTARTIKSEMPRTADNAWHLAGEWIRAFPAAFAAAAAVPSPSAAQTPPPVPSGSISPEQMPAERLSTAARTPVAEAWWTGPVSASSAETLPQGHFLVEPYLFNVRQQGSDYLGSLTYVLYGLTDRATIGMIPTFGSSRSARSTRPRRIAPNDLTLTAQYRLNRAKVDAALPTISIVLQQSLPLGRYDRLGGDFDLAIGTGVAGTLVGIYAQRVDRLPGGRPFRTRLNLTRTFAWTARVRDDSVYGTPTGFVGSARPGGITAVDLSLEYSLSRRWVLAVDLDGRWAEATSVTGRTGTATPVRQRLPSSRSYSIAPAVEYSWSATRGVLLGVRLTPTGRNASSSITPVVAFNAVF